MSFLLNVCCNFALFCVAMNICVTYLCIDECLSLLFKFLDYFFFLYVLLSLFIYLFSFCLLQICVFAKHLGSLRRLAEDGDYSLT
jgi:hypothetical protein